MVERNDFDFVLELCTQRGLGGDIEPLIAYADDQNTAITEDNLDDVYSSFEDRYIGEYDAVRGMHGQYWATGYVHELIDAGAINVPEEIRPYFNALKYAQDLELGGSISTLESCVGAVFVFSG